MGKHNGKARTGGADKVGSALVNRAKKAGRVPASSAGGLLNHTTDVAQRPGIQSVLESNDLTEIMTMADLAGRDFTAERGEAVVISTGAAVSVQDLERTARERAVAQDLHAHRLCIPRRPEWTKQMTAEELDAQERASFLAWRRDLAQLEEDEKLVLTPFEKNIEVWRQLWRVLERSDIVVQVIDARDPLTYRSNDLEDYARDIAAHKGSLLLLNKADLLPPSLRSAWADYFDRRGIEYVFWSAKAAADSLKLDEEDREDQRRQKDTDDARAHVLSGDELLEVFERKAEEAVKRASPAYRALQPSQEGQRRLVVGLTGYPNVGKSSTINALFGSKKTAVAATPGKTKHFQTLFVSDTLMLCDCPGLVLPKYASSKAEMVAAGVIPIDRLTNVRAPTEVVVRKAGVRALQDAYHVRLPKPAPHEDPDREPTAAEVLRAMAASRGWVVGAGLPDEARAGRAILKDFCDGKLLSYEWPPGHIGGEHQRIRLAAERRLRGVAPSAAAAALQPPSSSIAPQQSAPAPISATQLQSAPGSDNGCEDGSTASGEEGSGEAAVLGEGAEDGGALSQPVEPSEELHISAADLALMEELDISIGSKQKQKRAAHKFNRKPARTKGDRGVNRDGSGVTDGGAFAIGRKGGIIRGISA